MSYAPQGVKGLDDDNEVKPDRTRQNMGRAIKYNFTLCAAGDAGNKGAFDSNFNLKIFYSGSHVSVTHMKSIVTP